MPVETQPKIDPVEIPDETREPIITPVEDLPSLDPPDDDKELHIAKEPGEPEHGALCGRRVGSNRLHDDYCGGDLIPDGSTYRCVRCDRSLCKTCLDMFVHWWDSGSREW